MRTTDQEVQAIEKIVCYSSQKDACHAMQGHMRKHLGQSGGRRSEGKAPATVFFFQEGIGKAG